MWWKYPFTRGKTVFVRCFLFQHSVMTNRTIFWTLLRSNAYEIVQDFVLFLSGKEKRSRYRLSTHMLIFVVNIRPAQTFWNSTHRLLFPFTLDWSRNLWHKPMWNMAVNNSVVAFKWHVTEVTCYLFTVIWHIPSTVLGVDRLYTGVFHYSLPVSFIFRLTNHATPSSTDRRLALTHNQRKL